VLLPGQEKVLVAGGSLDLLAGGGAATNTTEVIDMSAASPAWSYTGSMTYARYNENLVLLADGTVLAVGGGGGGGRYANPVLTAELYDPKVGQWTVLAAQSVQRSYHSTAALLPDGRVVSAGSDNGVSTQVTYEIFNPPGMTGNPAVTTEPLYVLVPMFSTDNDQNPNDAISCTNVVAGTTCGPALGTTLISLFGALPEAFKAKPSVYTQCPEPGSAPGTCTMHASRLDLGPVLVALGYVQPPVANIFVPTPNHSHVVIYNNINVKPIWWQVIPVLVLNQSDWPTQNGSSGLTSIGAIHAALAAGTAVQAPSNFFLFFSSYAQSGHHNM